jgi:hypothetical protein
MTRITTYDRVNRRKSILKGILKEMRSSIEPDNARSKISSLKSNGISAEQNSETCAARRKSHQISERSETSLEMAEVYR